MAHEARPPASAGATVVVPRSLLIALGAGLGMALLALAFLLGRETAPRAKSVAASRATGNDKDAPTSPALEPSHVASLAPPSAEPETQARESSTPYAATSSPGTPTTRAAVDPNLRAAVTRYFSELDAIEAVAKTWSDPQQLAMEIVQQSATGDSHGLDNLVVTQRQARERLRAVVVPDVCREHHALVAALMDEAIAMLNRLRQAVTAGDLDALQAITSSAHELEAQTKRLDALASSLKQRYVSAG
jgi:hypothetical protein